MRDTRSITERDGAAERGRRERDPFASWLPSCTVVDRCQRRACDEEAALALPCAVSSDPDRQQTDRQLIGAAVGIAVVTLPTVALHLLPADAPRRRPVREA